MQQPVRGGDSFSQHHNIWLPSAVATNPVHVQPGCIFRSFSTSPPPMIFFTFLEHGGIENSDFYHCGRVQRSQGTGQTAVKNRFAFKRGSVNHVYKKNGKQKLYTLRHELKQDLVCQNLHLKNNKNQMCVRINEKLSIKSVGFLYLDYFHSAGGIGGEKGALRVTTVRTNLAKWVLAATSLPSCSPWNQTAGGSDWFPVETHQR